MKIQWEENAFVDYVEWQKNDKKMLKKINALIKDLQRTKGQEKGIGKGELLKDNLSGYRSLEINKEHRLVYKIKDDVIIIAQCKTHYKR